MFDPHPNLQDIIAGWLSNHPEFSPTPAPSAVGSSADDQTAVAHDVGPESVAASCVQAHGEAGPVYVPSLATDSQWRAAAARIGVATDEYRRRRLAGERWCSGHARWHDGDAFYPERGTSYCRAYLSDYGRRRYQTQKQWREEAAS